jgi:hypothetical protein
MQQSNEPFLSVVAAGTRTRPGHFLKTRTQKSESEARDQKSEIRRSEDDDMNWLKQHYGSAEGPLGFPMTDKQAFALEAIIKSLPKENAYAYRKVVVGDRFDSSISAPGMLRTRNDKSPGAVTEVSSGERSDVSWTAPRIRTVSATWFAPRE